MNLRTAIAGTVLAAGAALSLASPALAAQAPAAAPAQLTAAAAASCGQIGSYGSNMTYGITEQRAFRAGTFCMTNGGTQLVFQPDGNLVVYKWGRAAWQSGTAGRGSQLILQRDGNMVVYSTVGASYVPVWQSNTPNGTTQRRQLAVQDDGNVVVYEVRYNGQQPQKVDAAATAAAPGVTLIARWQSGTGR